MKSTPSLGLLSILLLSGSVSAIEVVADSGCASSCIGPRGNVSDPRASSTQHDDLFCLDAHFSGGSEQTAKALEWQGCLSCEASSPSYAPGIHNDTENDVQMFLYNLRLNWAWCVLGFDGNNLAYNGNAFELCGNKCQPIRIPITSGIFNWTATIRYDYCDNDNSAFVNDFDACRSCLADTGNFTIMANYLRALDIACDQKPEQGKALDLGFNIFQTGSKTSELNSTSSSSASATPGQSTGQTNSSNNSGLSQGGKVGVGVGVGVGVSGALILLALGLCCLKRHKQRAQRGAIQGNIAGQTEAAGYFSGVSPAEQKYHPVEAPNNIKGPVEAPTTSPVEAPTRLNEAAELSSGPQSGWHELDSTHR